MNGEEIEGFQDEEITLIYPAALNGLMTIAGMAFNLSFARLGMMYDGDADRVEELKVEDAEGFVMSFSAQLDLSFLIPTSKRGNTGEKVDKVNQNVFANDEQKQIRSAMRIKNLQTDRQLFRFSYKNNKKTKVANNQNNKKEGDDDGDTDAKVEVKMYSTA